MFIQCDVIVIQRNVMICWTDIKRNVLFSDVAMDVTSYVKQHNALDKMRKNGTRNVRLTLNGENHLTALYATCDVIRCQATVPSGVFYTQGTLGRISERP